MQVIKAESIDAAVERILDELKEDANTTTRSISSRNNVICFDGWDGLGASAVLRAVAQRLAPGASAEAPPAGLRFDQIIHLDCSKWESRRALQRAIAEQLELPAPMMEMFDTQDEEDDFHGLAEGSRTEIPQVLRAMFQRIQELNRRFLVIFHNGSNEEIDLAIFGFLLSGYSTNKVLWTFQGRFRLYPRMKVDGAIKSTGTTDVFLSASCSEQDAAQELCSFLVRQEAAQVAHEMITTAAAAGGSSIADWQAQQVADCFLHLLKICWADGTSMMDYDLATHGYNYLVCDDIVQLQQRDDHNVSTDGDDKLWRAANDLQHDMRFGMDYFHDHNKSSLLSHLVTCHNESTTNPPYWTSPPWGVLLFPLGDMFRHINKLGVLKLSHCTFTSSPLFLYCHNLRFLWLDHCQDNVTSTNHESGKEEEEGICRCFQRLWVLDVRYMRCERILSAKMMDLMNHLRELNVVGAKDWDIGQLQGRLPNIRKLRVTKSTIQCSSCSQGNLLLGMNKMELLDFSGNRVLSGMKSLSIASNSTANLETIIISDGCIGLKIISLKGCHKLKNLLLGGLFEGLHSLDISGTAVKILDLSAMTARELTQLLALDCDKLCAILWPAQDKRQGYLERLRIDTTQSASTARTGEDKANGVTGSAKSPAVLRGARAPSGFYWYISVKDTRLLRSVAPFRNYFGGRYVHVEISSPSCPAVNVSGRKDESAVTKSGIGGSEQPEAQKQHTNDSAILYADAAVTIKDHLFQASEGGYGDAQTITQKWPCPDTRNLRYTSCYMYIQDGEMTNKLPLLGLEEYTPKSTITIPDFVCDRAEILHVHDSLSITSIPGHARWYELKWCRVERCPKLDFIFTVPQLGTGQGGGSNSVLIFCWLRTLWVSQLPKARFMWDMKKLEGWQIHVCSFEDVTMLHLDFCPRLINVLPFSMPITGRRLLETIEIVWCGDLRTVFPLHTDTKTHQKHHQEPPIATTVLFPNLKHVHLHELPKLRSICGSGRMYAPNLETIKIRGCWSLTCLPAVGDGSGSKKVECDCEKDWWERLQWDGLQANHHSSLYKPTHPRYYKKTMLRGSVLV
ncbi:unnamed protein product [Urochloa decumbens]|uniref:Disease resistance protein At4g27190-like leucine-rich repeats domain-containing protein n=1 Tax=Urochloa decumbens TaxID=240449 RepID=A0ABC9DCX0_9POAL